MRTLIIIPAYNEEGSILTTIEDIRTYAPDVDFVVINDCSTDNTKEILMQAGANVVNLPINLGIGGGVQTGYQYALENGYDIAIQFDGDGQHMAEYLHDLMAPIERGEANITIGSRFIKKEGFQSSALRRFGIVFLSGLIKMLCGVRVHDVTSGMRAADRKMIALYAENYAQDYPEPEAIVAANLAGAVIEEIPVQMRERQSGKSSIHSLKSIYYMIKVSIALAAYRITHRRVKS
ncbi:MAG: glycosyltransferase family 2 protein [Clostridia bacterium]|nr:glycosyltransferase family 2 protein [Clostridia bacterium]